MSKLMDFLMYKKSENASRSCKTCSNYRKNDEVCEVAEALENESIMTTEYSICRFYDYTPEYVLGKFHQMKLYYGK